ncbi:DUF5412 family protein [Jeotgalibacillus sp. R-1-5s-1]|uniref:DUF5412 family protein n=1 Tax=Jeotgalibacillus sp. R-1-5s-1 TaxID=2555897 RepID=UPI00106D8153|nr:DUF5412 family protein [Jeotgalibacillus sp. R-1-5s-1]TFE00854.1 hypothetical protein E2491_04920 [Jeotgalibacillus sp. R-1-5s-1]
MFIRTILLTAITVLLLIFLLIKIVPFLLKKKSFPRKTSLIFATFLSLTAVLFFYQSYFFTFDQTNGTRYKGPVESPTGDYTATSYFKEYGGAAGGVHVWVDITFHDHDNKDKTIYLSDAKGMFSLSWKDDATLSIVNKDEFEDTSTLLNVESDIYHDTGLACQSLIIKDEYENCYANES